MKVAGRRTFELLALAGLAWLGAASVTIPAADGQVRVYSNADLEKFGPPSAPKERSELEAEWDAVAEYLEREYARIAAERQYLLAQRASDRADRLVENQVSRRPVFVGPWWGAIGAPLFFHPNLVPRVPTDGPWPGERPRIGRGSLRAFMSYRDTIHGRPRLSARGHAPTAPRERPDSR